MRKVLLAGTMAILLLFSISAVSLVKASPSGGAIQLIGKEWDHDPLKVYIHAPLPFEAYVVHVGTALNDWSSRLEAASEKSVDGSEIGKEQPDGVFDFIIVGSSKDADIVIHIQKGAYAGVLGFAMLQDVDGDGYIDKVKITVKVGLGATEEDFRNVIRHEIGHALGLGHEITTESDLMDPTYDASAIDEDVYPSTLDIDALLSIYYNDGFGLPNSAPSEIPPSYSA